MNYKPFGLSLIFYFIWSISTPITGQIYNLTRFGDEEGLPSRIIRDVKVDNDGFLWIGGNGLYKYDGRGFKSYYCPLGDTTCFRNNRISGIYQDRNEVIWVTTAKGLHYSDKGGFKYLKTAEDEYNESFIGVNHDEKGNVLTAGYGGLFRVNPESKHVQKIKLPGETESTNLTIWGISSDEDKSLITGIYSISILKSTADSTIALNFNFDESLKNENLSFFNCQKIVGNTYIIDSNIGLLKGQISGDTSITISRFIDTNGENIKKYFIYKSLIDGDIIWAATWKNRLKKFHFSDGKLTELKIQINNGWGDMGANVNNLTKDENDNIWVANTNGLFKMSEDIKDIYSFPPKHIDDCLTDLGSIKSITERESNLWLATASKIYKINKSDVLNRSCPEDFEQISYPGLSTISHLYIDKISRLWVTSRSGLYLFDIKENNKLLYHWNEKNGLPHNFCYGTIQVSDSLIYVANYSSLVEIKINDDPELARIKTYTSSQERQDALVNSFTLVLGHEEKSGLWVGTFSGVSQLKERKGEGMFLNFISKSVDTNSLSDNSIKDIFHDQSSRIWIGTQKGLNLYNPNTHSFIKLGMNEGLPSEYILGIAEDSNQYLWITTTNGVVKGKYDPASQALENTTYFTRNNGLNDNISNIRALLIDKKDNVYIGNSKGLNIIREKTTLQKPIRKTQLVLTELKVQGKPILIDQAIQSGVLSLKHNMNSISLSYASLNLTNPNESHYRHKLMPHQTEWTYTNNISELDFYNLIPGDYQLVLDASQNGESWSLDPIKINLEVCNPPWKSPLAMILYSLVLLGLIYFYINKNVQKKLRKLQNKHDLEQAIVKERELMRKQNVADFHDELGSKITKISLFTTLAERDSKDGNNADEWFDKIKSNVKDLSSSFRDLLWVIDPKKDSLGDTFERLKDFGEDLYDKSDVMFKVTGVQHGHPIHLLDSSVKKHVLLLFKEALINSAKHAEATEVILSLFSERKHSTIILRDNGKGIIDNNRQGRGMNNIKTRAKTINANLSVQTSEHGTVITLSNIPHMHEAT